jgi:hypothetical protein
MNLLIELLPFVSGCVIQRRHFDYICHRTILKGTKVVIYGKLHCFSTKIQTRQF